MLIQFFKESQLNGNYSMKEALLILGASADQLFMINTAHQMSLETVVVDGNPEAPGLKVATYSAPIDFSRTDDVISYVENLKKKGVNINGVLTMGSDVPQLVAKIANYFGWIGPSEETGRIATNKYEMKHRFTECGVPVPNYAVVHDVGEVRYFWSKWRCEKLVIKPTDRAGSRGVRMISDDSQIKAAFSYAREFSINNQIILEEYINGDQISTESLLFDDICVTPGFADREYKDMEVFHPNIIENGGWVPCNADTKTQNDVLELVEKAARALGITKGVAKGDVVICPHRGPMMIEMAARLSGGDFSESLVPFGCGINYVKTAIEIAMGHEPDFEKLKPEQHMVVANRYFFPPPGKLDEIIGPEKCIGMNELVKLDFSYKPGQTIPLMSNHNQRAGVFIVVDESRQKAQKIIDYIYDTVKFRINGKFYSGKPISYKE